LLESLTSHHPMVPFSPSAFSCELPSYAKEWLPAANRQGQSSGEFKRQLADYLSDATYPLELDLVELQRFWRLPVQYFFNRRLKVMFEPPLPVMEDDEPFVLDGLESYQMRDNLLSTLLTHKIDGDGDTQTVIAEFVEQQRAQGKLPIGAFGDIEFETNRVQAEELVEKLTWLCQSDDTDLEVKLTFDVLGEGKNVYLTGWLTQYYQSGLVRFRSGKIRAQDYLSAWIDHLSMCAMGHAKRTHMIGYDRKEGVVHLVYPPTDDASQAKALLSELVRLFYQGMTEPLAYFPKTALAC
ncbi:exonuclease V subunit gamma, partial [Vibrio xuii]